MQVDPASSYPRTRYEGQSEQAQAPSSYSFPPPPPPRTASADDRQLKREPSPPQDYHRPRTAESNFSYAAPPPGHQHGGEHPSTVESQQPRSVNMANFGDVDEGLFPRAGGGGGGRHEESILPNPGEYSQLGRTVVQGGNVRGALSSYQFNDYASGESSSGAGFQPHAHSHSLAYAQPQPHRQYARYEPYPTLSQGHPLPAYGVARGPAYASALTGGGPIEWAKPRMSQDDSAIGLVSSHRFGASSAPHTPRAGFAMGPPPPSQQHTYYSPYQAAAGSFGMVRSTSNQSQLSEATTVSGESTDYEGRHINPSYLGQAQGGYFAVGGDSGYYSSSDLHGVSGLRLDGASPAGTPRHRPQARTSRASSARTVRASSTATSSAAANGYKEPKRRTASTIFHPSPQSMLAPGATSPSAGSLASRKGRGMAHFPGTNSPALPTDEEFASMPTKRSRGRRPPCTPDLDLDLDGDADPNEEPTAAQLAYAGTTKTGKAKKIFLCKVPQCGKVFKRSEHLKRHVRSIHTHERPFQCQWPGCARYFSRHDNLNQHLRIHREPGVTDEEFSAELKRHFDRRLKEVQVEVAQENSRSPSAGPSGEHYHAHGDEGEDEIAEDEEGEQQLHQQPMKVEKPTRARSTRSRSRKTMAEDSDEEGDDSDGEYVP